MVSIFVVVPLYLCPVEMLVPFLSQKYVEFIKCVVLNLKSISSPYVMFTLRVSSDMTTGEFTNKINAFSM